MSDKIRAKTIPEYDAFRPPVPPLPEYPPFLLGWAYGADSPQKRHRGATEKPSIRPQCREYIESFVIEELLNHFSNSDVVSTITTQLNNSLRKKVEENSGEYNQYSTILQLLEDSRRNLLQAIKSGGYSKSLTKELNDVEIQMEWCRAKMEEVHQEMSDFPQFTEEQILNQIPNFKEFSKQADREEIRIRIQQYVERVTVYNDRVETDFSIPFSLTKNENVLYTFDSNISRSMLERRAKQLYLSPNFQYLTENLHSA